ncbi:ribosome small subunit-dependent GTPase A [Anaerofustis sp.]|uniref:ribosome small subunit-dependent GTPase A n=1 Tax=Anaerofustis sp. TaxID=1872517 RepID=UPI0025C55532|nr:ribosome small subunit-dependent GTPase A [Anaerofustis sp.]
MLRGKILKGVGSFYTVYSYDDQKEYVLKARGIFRKQKITPTVGDNVLFSAVAEDEGNIEKIENRKNLLIRPSISNVDNIIIVCAIKEPDISYFLLDKMIINASIKNVNLNVCFNKSDLVDEEEMNRIKGIYENAGLNVIFTSNVTDEGIGEVRRLLKNNSSVFMGVSGAGKSSLINSLFEDFNLQTSHVSRKIKRGRHTTRHCELFMEDENTFIADTPGFSSLEVFDVKKEDLHHYYNDFLPYAECKYLNCVHINEPNCGVKDAVNRGKINLTRYNTYKQIYEELKIKENKY